MQDLLVTAIIRNSHGVKGECNIALTGGDVSVISALKNGYLRHKGLQKSIEIEYLRGSVPKLILKIAGLDTPEAVNQLRGAEILRTRDQGPELAQDEFYTSDLVGCNLMFAGKKIGTILSVWDTAASSMIEVQRLDEQIVHIPFLARFIGEVDITNRTVELIVDWILE